TPGESKYDVSLPNEDVEEEQDSCPETELTDEEEELFRLRKYQLQIFFTTKFFPAFEHEIVLREKIKENKKQDAELAGLRKIQAEELARLIAEKEAEEAKRREAAAAEKALAELEESAKTLKGKPRKGALSKKEASGRGLSPKRSLLANKEAPNREPSSEGGPQGSRA
ncbi:RS10B protein, partial [Machaerirhynchus nigripectus]|nr:RS10B protein [Machaerirhynchus nigripectus]